MLLDYSYTMELEFSGPVRDQYFSLMCLPRDTERQKIISADVTVFPHTHVNAGVDGLGNLMLYGAVFEPHDGFRFSVSGIAETGLSPHEEYEDPGSADLWRYRMPSAFTVPGEAVRCLFDGAKENAPGDPYGKALYYAGVVRDALRYEPGSTDSQTSAEQALRQGSGVCQDFAHLLTAVLRMEGIPARYTVGLMRGEGESHAWTEANCRGYWYGIDPTNGVLADDGYIKIAHGRDYGDCMISRGIFSNPRAEQTMKVSVSVAEH